jgi:UDP-2,4-diacetamido-2,4,6-trideoxy-beta-L-altropyranose hydrolase
MKAIFRVDASLQAGGGHVMRCLALAEALRDRGVQTCFICRKYVGNLIALLEGKDMQVRALAAPQTRDGSDGNEDTVWWGVSPADDASQAIEALNGDRPEWLVVDHYGLDIEWERLLRPHVGRILAIDDLANRSHDCDILLDQNYSTDGDLRYGALVTSRCKVLLGPDYALLRKEFCAMRARLAPRQHRKARILVFFTTGDDQGETLKAMQGLELFGKAACVDVVVGNANPSDAQIKGKCDELGWRYHRQTDDMPGLIAQADLAIGAGGSSNWERCALGVPALVVILMQNQAPIAQALGHAGVIHNLGWGKDLQAMDYANVLAALSEDRLAEMSRKSLALVDARGTERIAGLLLEAQPTSFEQ